MPTVYARWFEEGKFYCEERNGGDAHRSHPGEVRVSINSLSAGDRRRLISDRAYADTCVNVTHVRSRREECRSVSLILRWRLRGRPTCGKTIDSRARHFLIVTRQRQVPFVKNTSHVLGRFSSCGIMHAETLPRFYRHYQWAISGNVNRSVNSMRIYAIVTFSGFFGRSVYERRASLLLVYSCNFLL